MDTRIAEYMITIQEERSLTKAASRLFITQSALNQQLKKLEQELGMPLFQRGKQGLTLTDAGKIYIAGARAFLQVKEQAMKQMEQLKSGPDAYSSIRIAFHHTFQDFFEYKIRPDFEEIYPYIPLETISVQNKQARSCVSDNQADLAIILSDKFSYSDLEAIPVRQEELHLAFPSKLMKDCPGSFNYPDLPASLKTQKLISAPPESFFVLAEQRYLRRAGLQPETLCQAASMQDFRFLLNQQFAIGLFPLSQIHDTDQFSHIPLEPSAHYYLQIVYKKELVFTPALRELFLIILRAFDSDYADNAISAAFR
ncbi:MAG: LysR family transcriptional regulator [Clostridiaceae bacterium]|nr:LysR family transcriptional regulator [Clostridiaceae bacterium]